AGAFGRSGFSSAAGASDWPRSSGVAGASGRSGSSGSSWRIWAAQILGRRWYIGPGGCTVPLAQLAGVAPFQPAKTTGSFSNDRQVRERLRRTDERPEPRRSEKGSAVWKDG